MVPACRESSTIAASVSSTEENLIFPYEERHKRCRDRTVLLLRSEKQVLCFDFIKKPSCPLLRDVYGNWTGHWK
jgi:hypothetical protein